MATKCSKEVKVNELATVLMEGKQRTGDKMVQNLLSIINDDSFDLSLFQKKYEEKSDCVEFVDVALEKQMSENGFQKKIFRAQTEISNVSSTSEIQ